MARHRKIPLNTRQLLTASTLDFKTLSYYLNENQFCGVKDVSDMPDKFDTTLTLFSKLLPSHLPQAELPR